MTLNQAWANKIYSLHRLIINNYTYLMIFFNMNPTFSRNALYQIFSPRHVAICNWMRSFAGLVYLTFKSNNEFTVDECFSIVTCKYLTAVTCKYVSKVFMAKVWGPLSPFLKERATRITGTAWIQDKKSPFLVCVQFLGVWIWVPHCVFCFREILNSFKFERSK